MAVSRRRKLTTLPCQSMSSALRPATPDCAPPRRQCFWSYREDAEITEDKIPFVIRGLREHGGLAGYEIAAELCH